MCRELGSAAESVKTAKLADLEIISTEEMDRIEARHPPKKRQMKPLLGGARKKASDEAFVADVLPRLAKSRERRVGLDMAEAVKASDEALPPNWVPVNRGGYKIEPNPAPAKRTSVARFGKSDWAGCGDHDNEKA